MKQRRMIRVITICLALVWAWMSFLPSILAEGSASIAAGMLPTLTMNLQCFNPTEDGQADAVLTVYFSRGYEPYAQTEMRNLRVSIQGENGLGTDRDTVLLGSQPSFAQLSMHLTVSPVVDDSLPTLRIHATTDNCGEADLVCTFSMQPVQPPVIRFLVIQPEDSAEPVVKKAAADVKALFSESFSGQDGMVQSIPADRLEETCQAMESGEKDILWIYWPVAGADEAKGAADAIKQVAMNDLGRIGFLLDRIVYGAAKDATLPDTGAEWTLMGTACCYGPGEAILMTNGEPMPLAEAIRQIAGQSPDTLTAAELMEAAVSAAEQTQQCFGQMDQLSAALARLITEDPTGNPMDTLLNLPDYQEMISILGDATETYLFDPFVFEIPVQNGNAALPIIYSSGEARTGSGLLTLTDVSLTRIEPRPEQLLQPTEVPTPVATETPVPTVEPTIAPTDTPIPTPEETPVPTAPPTPVPAPETMPPMEVLTAIPETPTPMPVPTEAPTPTPVPVLRAVTTTKNVNVRSETDKSSKKIEQLNKKGTEVIILDSMDNAKGELWYLVETASGRHGYIRGDMLQILDADGTETTETDDGKTDDVETDWGEELVFSLGSFSGDKKYPVYSAPSKKSWRGAKGKASVGTGGNVWVAGQDQGWLLVYYETNQGSVRVGYMQDGGALRSSAPELRFAYTAATVTKAATLTDDPAGRGTTIRKIKKGETVTVLATYRDLIYVETTAEGKTARGFLPEDTLE